MKVSALLITEELKGKLIKYPSLVDMLQNKNARFIDELNHWMKEIEIILKNNNIAECAEIAGYRGKIISPIYNDLQRMATKKNQLRIASELLYEIQHTVLMVMSPYQKKVDESRELIKQLLEILNHSNAIKFTLGSNFQSFVQEIWSILSTHEQLKPSALKILMLISQTDALRMIAEEIDLEKWQ